MAGLFVYYVDRTLRVKDLMDRQGGNAWLPLGSLGPLHMDPEAVEARVGWKDQGWGNAKGRIRAVLRRGGEELGTEDLFGIAGHSFTTATFQSATLAGTRPQTGDTIAFEYHVGGGGGHARHP